MNDAFAQGLEGWHDFYLLIGTASATLVGLLFVALTLNAEILRRDEFGATRALARRSFFCFINLVVVAGILLIPRQSPRPPANCGDSSRPARSGPPSTDGPAELAAEERA